MNMPRPRPPPTPSDSADLFGKEQSRSNGLASVFSLPPPAMKSNGHKYSETQSNANSTWVERSSSPVLPNPKSTSPSRQRKRTLSGTTKLESEPSSPNIQETKSSLPPPPSRTRKIIQMKPKQTSAEASKDTFVESKKPSVSEKDSSAASAPNAKRKQAKSSTASAAAGRKIARKTAHSIIERRRRSKMNEEFAVLKDMIPACTGIEMHKLAILQAGIEYVRYLEGCIEQLQVHNEDSNSGRQSRPGDGLMDNDRGAQDDDNNGDDDDDDGMDVDGHFRSARGRPHFPPSGISEPSTETESPAVSHRRQLHHIGKSSISTSGTSSSDASPALQPIQTSLPASNLSPSGTQIQHRPSLNAASMSRAASPTSVSSSNLVQSGVSPAFMAIQFSPNLNRTSNWPTAPTASSRSPNILPLPHSALPITASQYGSSLVDGSTVQRHHEMRAGEGQAEATATAALLMMTKDRRGSVGMGNPRSRSGKGMSVKDLLSS